MKSENVKIIVVGSVVVLAGIAVYFGIIKPITNKLGFTKSREDREEDRLIEGAALSNGFDPTYHKKRSPNRVTVSRETGMRLAKNVHDFYCGHLFCDDDEEKLYGAIKQTGTLTNLSYVSDLFYEKYGRSMYDFIENYTSDSELARVGQIVNNLKR